MSPLPPEAIAEFQTLFRQQRGEDLPDAEARECAEALIAFFRVVSRPIPRGIDKEPEASSNCHIL